MYSIRLFDCLGTAKSNSHRLRGRAGRWSTTSVTRIKLNNVMLFNLWQADCFFQADCHGQINLVKNYIFSKSVLKGC